MRVPLQGLRMPEHLCAIENLQDQIVAGSLAIGCGNLLGYAHASIQVAFIWASCQFWQDLDRERSSSTLSLRIPSHSGLLVVRSLDAKVRTCKQPETGNQGLSMKAGSSSDSRSRRRSAAGVSFQGCSRETSEEQ